MSMPGFDVIVCGSLHLDIMIYAPSFPRPDETVPGRRGATMRGHGRQSSGDVGSGRSAHRDDRPVGADDFGDKLLQHLVAEGVDRTGVAVDRSTGSGMSAAIVQDDGDYGAVIVSGSNLRIEPETVDQHWSGLRGGRVLVLQNEVPEPVNLAAATVARRDGARVVLNAAPARPMAEKLLEKIDVLVVNRVEAEMLSGRPVANREDAFEAARKLRASGRAAIVTLGGLGLVIHGDDEQSMWTCPRSCRSSPHTAPAIVSWEPWQLELPRAIRCSGPHNRPILPPQISSAHHQAPEPRAFGRLKPRRSTFRCALSRRPTKSVIQQPAADKFSVPNCLSNG